MASEIKTRITLSGAEEVKAQLKSISETGVKALGQIKAAGSSVADGGKLAEKQLQAIGLHLLQAQNATNKFREALHVVHPVLDAAGLGVGNLRALSAAASVGLGGLAVAITGGILVGLEKLQDEAARAKEQLQALGATKKDIAGLDEAARKVGFAPGVLAQGYQAAATAQGAAGGPQFLINRFGPQPGPGALPGMNFSRFILETLPKITQIGAPGREAAQKEYQAIAGGGLTPQVIQQLSPGTAKEFGKLFGLPPQAPGGLTPNQQLEHYVGPGGLSGTSLQMRLAPKTTDIDKQFDTLKSGPQKLDDAISDVTQSLKGLAEGIGRVGLADQLEKVALGVNRFADSLGKPTPSFTGALEKGMWEGAPIGAGVGAVVGGVPSLGLGMPLGAAVGTMGGAVVGGTYEATKYLLGAGGAPPASSFTERFSGLDQLKQSGDAATAMLKELASAGEKALQALQIPIAPTGHAEGGHVRGPGTGTSDSILARLSHGEYVVNARAVSSVGVSFMDRLNALKGGGPIKLKSPIYPFAFAGGENFTSPKFSTGDTNPQGSGVFPGRGFAEGGALDPKLPTGVLLGEGGPQTIPGAVSPKLEGLFGGGLADLADNLSSSFAFSAPRFEDGGPAKAAGHYTFDLRTDRGTLKGYAASKGSIDALHKESRSQQVVATTQWSPSWQT